MKIAVLDPDSVQAKSVCEILMHGLHECHTFTTKEEFSKRFRSAHYDLLVLSLQGAESEANIVAELRKDIAVPILCISGSRDEDRLIASLDAGVDDYLVRPIRRMDLMTRISVLLRRTYPAQMSGEQLTFGSYSFETGRDRVTMAGKPLDLTKKEFELALLFFRNLGRPLSRATITDSVWRTNTPDLSRTVDTHISRVRNKLDLTPARGYRLSPVYGFGYRLDVLKAHDAGN
jgi:DNA-binding response OmpR family regulator